MLDSPVSPAASALPTCRPHQAYRQAVQHSRSALEAASVSERQQAPVAESSVRAELQALAAEQRWPSAASASHPLTFLVASDST